MQPIVQSVAAAPLTLQKIRPGLLACTFRGRASAIRHQQPAANSQLTPALLSHHIPSHLRTPTASLSDQLACMCLDSILTTLTTPSPLFPSTTVE